MRRLSRLDNLENADSLKKAAILALVIGGMMLTAALVGLPILVRLAIFIGELNSANRPVDKNDIIPPTPPRILLPYVATNSAQQTITGLAEPGTNVFLTKNGESLGSVVVKGDGIWEFNRIVLKSGENKFVAIAVDQAGNNSPESAGVNMQFLTKAPDLTIDTPTDKQVITENNGVMEIKGKTSAGVRVTVNDRTMIVGGDGRFASNFVLNEGENALVFVATDSAGNQTRREMTVEYRK